MTKGRKSSSRTLHNHVYLSQFARNCRNEYGFSTKSCLLMVSNMHVKYSKTETKCESFLVVTAWPGISVANACVPSYSANWPLAGCSLAVSTRKSGNHNLSRREYSREFHRTLINNARVICFAIGKQLGFVLLSTKYLFFFWRIVWHSMPHEE